MLPTPFDILDNQSVSRQSFARGAHVFRQGDESRGIYFLCSGAIEMARVTETGDAVIIYNAKAGETFAEPSLYSDRYHCDAICTAASDVIRISKAAILARQRTDAAFSAEITKRLAQQVQDYRQLLALHAVKSAPERVLLAISLGKLTGSITQLASQIGLTREACYRALKDLSEQGLIEKTGRGRYAPAPGGRRSGG